MLDLSMNYSRRVLLRLLALLMIAVALVLGGLKVIGEVYFSNQLTDTGLIINAELAGVKKEDVSVELKDNVLTIKGERWSDREVDEQSYYRKERCFGTFQRSFTLRETVQPDQIKARFKDGILEIEIPRAKQEEP